MKLDIKDDNELPNGITATYAHGVLTIKGPKGEVSKKLFDPQLKVEAKGNAVTISCKKATKNQKRMVNTFNAHIGNMIKGVQEQYRYVLKICSGHFPMNVTMSGEQLIVKNFLGEKNPRTLKLKKGATVKVDGEKITVESCDKELAGKVSSDIELLTSKRNRDLRVFQDGIYLIEKANKPLGASQ